MILTRHVMDACAWGYYISNDLSVNERFCNQYNLQLAISSPLVFQKLEGFQVLHFVLFQINDEYHRAFNFSYHVLAFRYVPVA